MKRSIKYIAIFLMISLTGCQGFLDKEPFEDYQHHEVLETVEGLDALLNGTYALVKDRYYYGAAIYQYEAAKGLDFFIRDVGGGSSMSSEANYSSSSTSSGQGASVWQTIYSVVTNTNLILENVDKVKGDEGELRRVKGEALALRGLAYFDLLRLFSYPPRFSFPDGSAWSEEENNYEKFMWGVPIIYTLDMSLNPEKYDIRREDAVTSWDYVVEQLNKAKELLEGRADRNGHINSATVSALLIRAYMYMEMWPEVVSEGEEWLTRYEDNYSMIPYENYAVSYYKPFNTESIWEIGYTESTGLGSNSLNYWLRKPTDDDPDSQSYGKVVKDVGYARVGMQWGHDNRGLNFLNRYPDDVRQVMMCDLGILDHPEYVGFRKYIGEPFHSLHNIPVVRLPEVYLTLAEGYNKTGEFNLAGEMASKVSSERRLSDINGSDVDNIYDERRREFMLEGHTFFDMFRTGRNIRNRQYIEMASNGSISFGQTTSQHYRVVYPIPLRELNANPEIRPQQNPGYSDWVPGGEE